MSPSATKMEKDMLKCIFIKLCLQTADRIYSFLVATDYFIRCICCRLRMGYIWIYLDTSTEYIDSADDITGDLNIT